MRVLLRRSKLIICLVFKTRNIYIVYLILNGPILLYSIFILLIHDDTFDKQCFLFLQVPKGCQNSACRCWCYFGRCTWLIYNNHLYIYMFFIFLNFFVVIVVVASWQLKTRRQPTKPKVASAATEAALKEVKSRAKKGTKTDHARPTNAAVVPKQQRSGRNATGGVTR
jgi:hypothetical protein